MVMMTSGGNATASMHEAALEALDVPVLVHDLDTIIFANAAARRFLRAGRTVMVGRDILDIVHPDGQAAGTERRRLVLERGQKLDDLPIKLRGFDGSTLYTTVNARRIESADGDAVLLFVGGRLVPDPRAQTEGAAEHPDIFSAALEALPTPVLVYNDDRVLYANPAAAKVLGSGMSSRVAGTPVAAFTIPELADINGQRRTFVLENGVPLRDLVVKIRGLDGATAILHVDIRRISCDDGSVAMATLSRL